LIDATTEYQCGVDYSIFSRYRNSKYSGGGIVSVCGIPILYAVSDSNRSVNGGNSEITTEMSAGAHHLIDGGTAAAATGRAEFAALEVLQSLIVASNSSCVLFAGVGVIPLGYGH
jgi:hypothetical protein